MTTIALPLTYRCPHCGTNLSVEPSTAGETLICPSDHCGKPFRADVPLAAPSSPLIVPGREQPDVPLEPLAVAATSAAVPERELAKVQLAMFRRYPVRLSLYVLATAIGITTVICAGLQSRSLLATLALVATMFPLYRLAAWLIRVRGTEVLLTATRCRLTTGFFKRQMTEMLLEDVREVRVVRSPLARLADVGDLIIVGDTDDSRQLVLMGVCNPEPIAERIRERL